MGLTWAHAQVFQFWAHTLTFPNLDYVLAYQTPTGYDFQYAGIGMN